MIKANKNIIVLILFSLFLLTNSHMLYSDSLENWEFDNTPSYSLSNEDEIEIETGIATLVQINQTEDLNLIGDYIPGEYTQTRSGPKGRIKLVENEGMYADSGEFISKIIDGEENNEWKRLQAAINNNMITLNMPYEISTSESGLVGLWHFNNGYNDATGVNNGFAHSTSFDTFAKFGSHSVRFDGTGEYVEVPDSPSLNPVNELTLSIWLYADSLPVDDTYGNAVSVIEKYYLTTGERAFRLEIRKSYILLTISQSGSTFVGKQTMSKTPLNPGEWTNLVITFKANEQKIYVNGSLDVSESDLSIADFIAPNSQSLKIGKHSDNGNTFNGFIDEVAIYNRVLNGAEIIEHYAKGSAARLQLRTSNTKSAITTKAFVGPDGTDSSFYIGLDENIISAGDCKISERYIQYKAYLESPSDRLQTPEIDGISIIGSKKVCFDYALSDYLKGSFSSTEVKPAVTDMNYLGIARKENGGYYYRGSYTSSVFDAGTTADWNQISWETVVQELDKYEKDLVGLWHLNGDCLDDVNSTFGNVHGSLAYTDNAKSGGYAGVFNGYDAYIEVVDNDIFDFGESDSFSIEFWLKSDQIISQWTEIIEKQDGDNLFQISWVDSQINPGRIKFWVKGGNATPLVTITSNNQYNDGEWHHIVMVRNRDTNEILMYVDGVRAVDPVTDNSIGNISNNSSLLIGAGSSGFFKGTLDEMAIYSKALTADEIRQHFSNEKGNYIAFQVRSGSTNPISSSFIGPDGTDKTFYTDSSLSDLISTVLPNRFFQYRVFMEGIKGNTTPFLKNVSIQYDGSSEINDNSKIDFDKGIYNDKTTKWYSDEIALSSYSNTEPIEIDVSIAGLIGLWHMNNSWVDASGAYHGTGYADVSFSSLSKIGSHCGIFDGTDAYVGIGETDDLVKSVEFWIKSNKSNNGILNLIDGQTYVDLNSNQIIATGFASPSIYVNAQETSSLNDGWNHVVIVTDVGIDASNINLGRANGIYFDGFLDEVAIYSRVLSVSEINSHAGNGYDLLSEGSYMSFTIDSGKNVNWDTISWIEEIEYGSESEYNSQFKSVESDEPGLISLWKFDEDHTDIKDAYNGNPVGDINYYQGKIGSCRSFDGDNDYINIGTIDTGINTLAFWINTNELTNNSILELTSNLISVYIENSTLKVQGFSSPKIYINGIENTYIGTGWNYIAIVSSNSFYASSMNIGKSGTNYFTGLLDEVCIYSRPFSHAEVNQHYTNQIGGDGIISLYHLDNSSDDVTGNYDASYNGNLFDLQGVYSKAIGFDGIDDVLTIQGSLPVLRAIEFWINNSNLQDAVLNINNDEMSITIVDGDLTTTGFPSHDVYVNGDSSVRRINYGWNHVAIMIPDGILVTKIEIGKANSDFMLGEFDEIILYSRTLSQIEVVDHYKRALCGLKLQISTDNGITWTDENGNIDEFIFENYTNMSLPYSSQTIEYRLEMTTKDYGFTPRFQGITFESFNFSEYDPYVIPVDGQEYLGYLLEFTQTLGAGNQGSVKYQISNDSGLTWYWWNGAEWTFASGGFASSNAASEINSHIESVYEQLGPGTFLFKAYLHSPNGVEQVELDNVAVRYSEGRVVILYPNGGEKLLTAAPHTIYWNSAGIVSDNLTIQYSKTGQNGPWYNAINYDTDLEATSEANDGQMRWAPPEAGTQYRIRIIDGDDPTVRDVSDGDFTVGSGFEVLLPNDGEKFYVGSTESLTWLSAVGMGSSVKLYYSLDGETFTGVIDLNAPNQTGQNTYSNWSIGFSEEDDSLYSETAKVKIEKFTDAGVFDVSDNCFTLAGLRVIYPNGGEKIKVGTNPNIQWKSAGAGDTVTIEYSTLSRLTSDPNDFTVVTSSAPNTGGLNSYSDWTVDADTSNDTVIRISSNSDGNLIDQSDAVFSFSDVIMVSPDGGEVWQAESTANGIVWNSIGAGSKVTISYSLNGGETWIDYDISADNSDGQNTYTWTIPGEPGNNVKVKVASNDDETLLDISQTAFSIAGVKVETPNGGENTDINAIYVITWDEQNAGATGSLYYSADGGENWYPITGGSGVLLAEGDAGFNWTPEVESLVQPTVRGKIKIVSDDPGSDSNPPTPLTLPMDDESNEYFTINGVRVTSPITGNEWLIGSSGNTINWTSAGTGAGQVSLYYSALGDFSDEEDIISVTNNEIYPGNNNYSWAVPTSAKPSTSAKIKVVAGSYTAISQPFTLKGMRVTAPSQGVSVTQDLEYTVQWDHAGVTGNANIYYSSDGGNNYNVTVNAVPIDITDGQYTWQVDSTETLPTSNARIKIEIISGGDSGLSAESEIFTLKGVYITAPAGGAVWSNNTTHDITWMQAQGGGTLDIYYASDGVTYGVDPINGETSIAVSSESYTWDIPDTITPASGMAKIKLVTDSGLESESSLFTMEGIKVTRPTYIDIWVKDAVETINWVAVGTGEGVTPGADMYDLFYVIDGTETQIDVAPNQEIVTTETYDWTIPPEAVNEAVTIRVKDKGTNLYSGNSATIEIVEQVKINIVSPAQDEVWKVGRSQSIRWSKAGPMDNDWTIEYDHDAGFSSPTVIPGTPSYDTETNTYSLDWSIPDDCGDSWIRITNNVESFITDISEGFKMVPDFELVVPNGGETFYALKPTTVSWYTTGTAGNVDLYYSYDAPLYTTWNKINATPVSDNGSGLTPAVSNYDWTVANLQSNEVKFKVEWAGETLAYDVSDAVFTIGYYTITWVVKNDEGNELGLLSVQDSSGWSDVDQISPVDHFYPYGTYTTLWSRIDYQDETVRDWVADMDKTIEVVLEPEIFSAEYHVSANFTYDATNDEFKINAWMEREGKILSNPTKGEVHIFNSLGDEIQVLTSMSPDGQGVFWLEWPTAGLDENALYFSRIDITYGGIIYSSGLAYNIYIPKALAGLGSSVESMLLNVQDAIGENLAQKTDEIIERLGETEDSLADQLSVSTSALQSDIDDMGVDIEDFRTETGEKLDELGTDIGAILEDTTTNLPTFIVEEIATQLQLQTQGSILTRPDSVTPGDSATIRFQSFTGVTPKITVYDSDNTVRLNAAVMTEIGTTGIYEYDVTFYESWGIGDFTVVCEEETKKQFDSMIINVGTSGISGVAVQVDEISTKVDTIDSVVADVLDKWDAYTATDIVGFVDTLGTTLGNPSDASGATSVFGKIAEVKEQTDMIVTIDDNIENVLNEVGSGNISAIKSKTDAINWGNVTGLVSTAGEIKAVTDAIDWNDVQTIKTATQDIDWSDVESVVLKWSNKSADDLYEAADNAYTTINSVRNELGAAGKSTKVYDDLQSVKDEVNGLKSGLDTVESTVNSISTALGTLDDSIATLETSVKTISQAASDIGTVVSSLSTSLDSIETKVSNLQTSVGNTNQTSEMLQSVESISSAIGSANDSTASNSVLGNIAKLESLIDSLSAAGTSSNVDAGKIDEISSKITSMEADVMNAANDARTAKTQATNAVGILEELKEKIAAGTGTEANGEIEKLLAELSALQETITKVPSGINTDNLTSTFNTVSSKLSQLASEQGVEGLTKMTEGTVTDLKDIQGQIGDLKTIMVQLRSLLDRNVNKPKIKSWMDSE